MTFRPYFYALWKCRNLGIHALKSNLPFFLETCFILGSQRQVRFEGWYQRPKRLALGWSRFEILRDSKDFPLHDL